MKRTAPSALGNIWGVFSILYGLVVMFVLLAPKEIGLLGEYFRFTQCILAHMDSINSFSAAGYVIGIGGFVLSILGLAGAGISRKYNVLGGILLLTSSLGLFILYYIPVLFGTNGVLATLEKLVDFGMIGIVIISFITIAVTLLGLAGGILALVPKKARRQQAN